MGHIEWRRAAEHAGLNLLYYENLDHHLEYGYSQLAEAAQSTEYRSADGMHLADSYQASANAAAWNEIGLNLALFEVSRWAAA